MVCIVLALLIQECIAELYFNINQWTGLFPVGKTRENQSKLFFHIVGEKFKKLYPCSLIDLPMRRTDFFFKILPWAFRGLWAWRVLHCISETALYKLDGEGPVNSDPPLTSSTTWSNKRFFHFLITLNWHLTPDIWHVTRETLDVTRNMWVNTLAEQL